MSEATNEAISEWFFIGIAITWKIKEFTLKLEKAVWISLDVKDRTSMSFCGWAKRLSKRGRFSPSVGSLGRPTIHHSHSSRWAYIYWPVSARFSSFYHCKYTQILRQMRQVQVHPWSIQMRQVQVHPWSTTWLLCEQNWVWARITPKMNRIRNKAGYTGQDGAPAVMNS